MATEEIDFTKPWRKSNVAFILEDQRVYANKTFLAILSPVLDAMFNGDFKERKDDEITLPWKKHQDFLQLMHVLHPPHKDIDGRSEERTF